MGIWNKEEFSRWQQINLLTAAELLGINGMEKHARTGIYKQYDDMMADVKRVDELKGTPEKIYTTQGLLSQIKSYKDAKTFLHPDHITIKDIEGVFQELSKSSYTNLWVPKS